MSTPRPIATLQNPQQRRNVHLFGIVIRAACKEREARCASRALQRGSLRNNSASRAQLRLWFL